MATKYRTFSLPDRIVLDLVSIDAEIRAYVLEGSSGTIVIRRSVSQFPPKRDRAYDDPDGGFRRESQRFQIYETAIK